MHDWDLSKNLGGAITDIVGMRYQDLFPDYSTQIREALNGIALSSTEHLFGSIGSVTQDFNLMINRTFAEAIKPQFDFGSFVTQLSGLDDLPKFSAFGEGPVRFGTWFEDLPKLMYPDLYDQLRESIGQLIEAGEIGEQQLRDAGFRFALAYFRLSMPFASYADVDPRVRNALLTKQLTNLTKSEAFEAEIADLMVRSRLLKRREFVLETAYRAHQRREYALSIPVFLAQMDGVFRDILVARQVLVFEKGQYYEADSNGCIKLDKNGWPITAKALEPLLKKTKWSQDSLLNEVSGHLLDVLVPQRNKVLHGVNTSYAAAQLSTSSLMIFVIFATLLAQGEAATA